jgi:hypothetical protein
VAIRLIILARFNRARETKTDFVQRVGELIPPSERPPLSLDLGLSARNQCPAMYPQISPIIPSRRPNPFDDPAWASKLKLDGFRGLADAINGRMLSKNLNPLKRYRNCQKSGLFIGCTTSLCRTICEMNLEGVVCKRLEDHYAPDVRWFKVLNPA